MNASTKVQKPVCVVVGVGPGNGVAFGRRFATAGYALALMARTASFLDEAAAGIPGAKAFPCDVTDSGSVERGFAAVRNELGPVEVLIYNAGSATWGNVEEVSAADFEADWRTNTLGALLTSKEVIPAMKQAGRGSIVIVGATSSRRGSARAAAFAPAKGAQRSLAESMARHLWPAGIHVALVVVDGIIDLEATRRRMPGKPDAFFVKPDDVADVAYALTVQKRSAWSFEVEARPFGETW